MKESIIFLLLFLISGIFGCVSCGEVADIPIVYYGSSDASAAVSLSKDLFVVADDENNVLRVYKAGHSSLPVYSYDLTEFLEASPDRPEADIEGAAMVGDVVYWISSHGRNKDGKMRPGRYRFFATSVKVKDSSISIKPVGVVCKSLIHEMIKSGATQKLGLDDVTQLGANLKNKQRERLAPKDEGLNIESLCATPDGKTLYIGFRNPQFFDREASRKDAIIVPLLNCTEVIEKGKRAEFGEPVLLDLGGLGIRSMEYSRFHKTYFIVAGAHDEAAEFVLYKWGGKREEHPAAVKKFDAEPDDFTPEALVVFEESGGLFVLSDDGSVAVDVSGTAECMEGEMLEGNKCPNKHLIDQDKKFFRGTKL